jgi:hypothetical protein
MRALTDFENAMCCNRFFGGCNVSLFDKILAIKQQGQGQMDGLALF